MNQDIQRQVGASVPNKPKLADALGDLKAEVQATPVPVGDALTNVIERQAMKDNLEEAEETKLFWEKFFGEGIIATILTKISLLGVKVDAGDISSGEFWEDVGKFEKQLEGDGVVVEDKIAAHRLNSVEKLKEAVARGEKQIEFDVRLGEGGLYLSHGPGKLSEDTSFDQAMIFLSNHPDVKICIDIKEYGAAQEILKKTNQFPVLNSERCMLMTHNPKIAQFLSKASGIPATPLVFHYIPLAKAPFPVRTTVKMLGGVGTKKVADMIDNFYPGDFYGAGTNISVNGDWSELQGKSKADEMYCAWDIFPPDDLINELQATGRQVWISVPYELVPDGMREWADKRGLKLLLHGADNMNETADALKDQRVADLVMSDAAADIDDRLKGDEPESESH